MRKKTVDGIDGPVALIGTWPLERDVVSHLPLLVLNWS